MAKSVSIDFLFDTSGEWSDSFHEMGTWSPAEIKGAALYEVFTVAEMNE